MAQFRPIDLNTWKRTPYFNHYFNKVRCTYSMTVNIDITSLLDKIKSKGVKLYPTLIFALTKVVNNHEEFRTAINQDRVLGIWDQMNPSYTIFQKESETFTSIWSEWDDNFEEFISRYQEDVDTYGQVHAIDSKPDAPQNCFPISSLPWVTFSSFNLNIFADGTYLLPIFTWGKYFEESNQAQSKIVIPLSIQVHHAVCDGFHISRFANELQEIMNEI